MIFSISNIAWNPSERLKAYDIMNKNNFTGLEIAPGLLFYSSKNPLNPSKNKIRLVSKELNSRNLELVSIQSLLFNKKDAFLFGNNHQKKKFINALTEVLNFAGKLEIPNLVFGSPKNRNIPINMKHEEALNIAMEVFYYLGEIACLEGTKISIEANPIKYGTNFLNETSDVISFVKTIDNKGIKSTFDMGAVKMNDNFSIIEELITRAIPQLNHVHISEPNLKPAPNSLVEFSQVFKILTKVGYEKAISIEMKKTKDSLENILASTNILNEAIDKT